MRSMRSSRRTTATAPTATSEGVVAASAGTGVGGPSPEMDPWKEDRVRDFVSLNTIQRLRGYHLPHGAPMPAMEAVNVARARNLILLPRANPDYRPCQLEKKPTAAALRQRRRQRHEAHRRARAAKQALKETADAIELRQALDSDALSSSLSSFSSLSSTPSTSSDDDEHDDGECASSTDKSEHGTENASGSPATRPTRPPFCALEKARVVFFGAASFTSSASPHRLLASPHVPVTPSHSQSARGSTAATGQSPLEGLRPPASEEKTLKPPELADQVLEARVLFGSTPLKSAAAERVSAEDGAHEDDASPAPRVSETQTDEAPSPSPHKVIVRGPPDAAGTSSDTALSRPDTVTSASPSSSSAPPPPPPPPPAFEGQCYGCEVCEALHDYFQSLLTRGVVLDRFNHKELAFAWWVVGRNMDTDALDHVGPLRREPLLISLRNYYFNLLTKHEAKRRAREQRRAAAAAEASRLHEAEHEEEEEGEKSGDDGARAGEGDAGRDPAPLSAGASATASAPARAKRRRSDAVAPTRQPTKARRKAPQASSPSPSSSASSASRSRSSSPPVPTTAAGSARARRKSEIGAELLLVEGSMPPGVIVGGGSAPSRASSTASNRRSAEERRKAVEDTWSSVRHGRPRPTSSTTSLAPPEAETDKAIPAQGTATSQRRTAAATTKAATHAASISSAPAPASGVSARSGQSEKKAGSRRTNAPPPPPKTTSTAAKATSNPAPLKAARTEADHASTPATTATSDTLSKKKAPAASGTKSKVKAEPPAQASRRTSPAAPTATAETPVAVVDTTEPSAASRVKKSKGSQGSPTSAPVPPSAPRGTAQEEASGAVSQKRETSDGAGADTNKTALTANATTSTAPTPSTTTTLTVESTAGASAQALAEQRLATLLRPTPFQTSVETRVQQRLAAEDSPYTFLMASATHQRDAKGRPLMPKYTPTSPSAHADTTSTDDTHRLEDDGNDEDAPCASQSASASTATGGGGKGRRGRHSLSNKGAVDPSLFLSTYRYDHDAFDTALQRQRHGHPEHLPQLDGTHSNQNTACPEAGPRTGGGHTPGEDLPFPPPISGRYDAHGHRLANSYVAASRSEVMGPPAHAALRLEPLPDPPHTHALTVLPYAQQCLLVWEAASRIATFEQMRAERERQKTALLSAMRMTTRRMRATIVESEPSVAVAKLGRGKRKRSDTDDEDSEEDATPWQAAPRLPLAAADDEDEDEEGDEQEEGQAARSATPSSGRHGSEPVKVKKESEVCARDHDVHSVSSNPSGNDSESAPTPPARCYLDYWAYYRTT